MHFDFEAAAISISIGVVVAVLLQGTLLDRADAENVPPQTWRALQALDIWLAVVFVMVVGVTIAVPVIALTNGRPLRVGDRRLVAHLLLVAGAYPALIAIVRRTLPVLYGPMQDDAPSARLRLSILVIPLLGLPAAMALVAQLIARGASFRDSLLIIGLAGVVVAGPAVLAPWLAGLRPRGRRPTPAAAHRAQRARSVRRSPTKPG